MSEQEEADLLAELVLEDSSIDPDDTLSKLARQLLRRGEVIERLEKDALEKQCHECRRWFLPLDQYEENCGPVYTRNDKGRIRVCRVCYNTASR